MCVYCKSSLPLSLPLPTLTILQLAIIMPLLCPHPFHIHTSFLHSPPIVPPSHSPHTILPPTHTHPCHPFPSLQPRLLQPPAPSADCRTDPPSPAVPRTEATPGQGGELGRWRLPQLGYHHLGKDLLVVSRDRTGEVMQCVLWWV